MFRRNATSMTALLLAGALSFASAVPAFAQDDNGRRGEHREQEHRGNGQQRQQQAAPRAQAPAQNFQPRGNGRNEGAPQGGGQEWRGRRSEQAPQANAVPRAPQQNFQQPPAQNFRRAPNAQPAPQREYRDYAERRFTPPPAPDQRRDFAARPAPQRQYAQPSAPDQRRDFAARPAPQQQYAQRYEGRRDFGRGPGTTMRVDGWRDHRWAGPRTSLAIHRRAYVPAYYRPHYLPRERWFRDVYVYRPYGLAYPGFGFYYTDDEAYRWLGLASLSFAAYSELDEMEQRAADEALIEATDADIGESITWNEDGASGSVTPIRDGESADGRPCREFQEDVVIDGRRQTAYGTACVQQDGSWQVVNN